MHVFVSSAGLTKGHLYGTFRTKKEAQEALRDLDSNLRFGSKSDADIVVVPDGVEHKKGEVEYSAFAKSLKNEMSRASKASRKPSKASKKSSSQKTSFKRVSKTSRKSHSRKASSQTRRTSKPKKRSGGFDYWQPTKGVWHIYFYDNSARDKYNWGYYGPTRQEFVQRVQDAARDLHQRVVEVTEATKADVVIVPDWSGNRTRNEAAALADGKPVTIGSWLLLKNLKANVPSLHDRVDALYSQYNCPPKDATEFVPDSISEPCEAILGRAFLQRLGYKLRYQLDVD